MYIENKNYIKISESEFVQNETLKFGHEGNIQIIGHEITFSNIEFDSKFLFYGHGLECTKDKNYPILNATINKIIAIYKDGTPQNYKINEITGFEFNDCRFVDNVEFELSNNFALIIGGCIFEKSFTINNVSDIAYQEKQCRAIKLFLEIKDSLFEDVFLLKKFTIKNCQIQSVEFNNDFRVFNCIFDSKTILFVNVIFKKSLLLEKATFKKLLQFKYCYFKGYILFRDLVFKRGLNLDYTGIENEINFFNLQGLDTKESKNETSEETYRIIKYNLDKVSKKKEANKYFMMEMNKYKDRIPSKNISEKMIFYFNDSISSFGQNWMKALIFYFLFAFVFSLLAYFCIPIKCISFIELLTASLNPLDKEIIQNYNLWGLIYKVFSGLILYQLIIALKRQTIR